LRGANLTSIAILEAGVPKNALISVVDDDESVREGTKDLLRSMGFAAETFPRADDFLKSDALRSTSCLIADVQMPGMTGLELHERLVASGKVVPTILITAFPDKKDRAKSLRAGVVGYLTKPFNESELLAAIQSALEHRKTDRGGS
jgi:FixJ family two-component response regulator